MSRWWLSAILVFLVQALPHAVPATTIHGSIVDGRLNPLAGAALTLASGGREIARATSDTNGRFTFAGIAPGDYVIRATHSRFPAVSRSLKVTGTLSVMQLPLVMSRPEDEAREMSTVTSYGTAGGVPSPRVLALPAAPSSAPAPAASTRAVMAAPTGRGAVDNEPYQGAWDVVPSGETYAPIRPNQFQSTSERRLSTFGADVDTASFTNVRRLLSTGQRPPRDAVRIEELVNYFKFAYAGPMDGTPLAITTEIGDCPWDPSHKLLLIGARAATPPRRAIEGRNLVLLIDVSGSMEPAERLPMIKTALQMFVETLTANDTISIVTYAGSSGVALPPTNGRQTRTIQAAISELGAGGSTNGAQGLITAYRIARQRFISGGVNRVILATDGDFNVGITSQHDLHRLIERERESGVFLSVLGVGSGNLKDQTMEMLADKGNGNYSYLDSLQEARRVLISEADATLMTVAKDVKFQVEFNPDLVAQWKLIGYENRRMAARDFENDRKDAGEMGSGRAVTVMYELIPARRGGSAVTADWFTVNARYKLPEGETSQLITHRGRPSERPEFLPFAAAVAEFGLLLRDAPGDSERWDALARRLAMMRPSSGLADGARELGELVTLAKSMARIPR